jgi:hypothetical protein
MDFNPYLKPWNAPQPNNVAGKGQIEVPGQVENIVWQHRAAPPSAYENALGDALVKAFGDGAETLDQLVDALNAQAFRTAGGGLWSAAELEAEMARLGA